MLFLRPNSALRASRCFTGSTFQSALAGVTIGPPSRSTAAVATALFSTQSSVRAADHAHGESHYDPPSGWLWGVKPGEKYQKEGWETIWVWGFFGSLGMAVVAYAFKPDTSIQTWALEEARRRLEAEGILKEPDDSKS